MLCCEYPEPVYGGAEEGALGCSVFPPNLHLGLAWRNLGGKFQVEIFSPLLSTSPSRPTPSEAKGGSP
jgi:hypothetical protein